MRQTHWRTFYFVQRKKNEISSGKRKIWKMVNAFLGRRRHDVFKKMWKRTKGVGVVCELNTNVSVSCCIVCLWLYFFVYSIFNFKSDYDRCEWFVLAFLYVSDIHMCYLNLWLMTPQAKFWQLQCFSVEFVIFECEKNCIKFIIFLIIMLIVILFSYLAFFWGLIYERYDWKF